MARESAEDPDVSVSLPPDLERWLDEQAQALDTDRQDVLVRFLNAYRTAADGAEPLADAVRETDLAEAVDVEKLLDGALGERIDERTDARFDDQFESRLETELEETREGVERLHRRVESLETDHEENVEDLRGRILQLRDAVQDRAQKDHTHEELRQLSGRVDSLSESLESVGTDVAEFSEAVSDVDDRLGEVEAKLGRLARVVVTFRRQLDELDAGSDRLEKIKETANRSGVTKAECEDCGASVQPALLNEPFCPDCSGRFSGIERRKSILGRFRAPLLRTEEPSEIENDG